MEIQAVAIFVATGKNVDEMLDVVDLVAAVGGRRMVLSELQPVGSAAINISDLLLPAGRFLEVVTAASRRAQDLGISVKIIRHGAPGALDRFWPRWSLSPSGDLKLCNFSSKSIGSVHELSDERLEALIGGYMHGSVDDLAGAVDNCGCLRAARSRATA